MGVNLCEVFEDFPPSCYIKQCVRKREVNLTTAGRLTEISQKLTLGMISSVDSCSIKPNPWIVQVSVKFVIIIPYA